MIRERKYRIVKKCLRNGKIFSRIVEFEKFNPSLDLWEGDTYKLLSVDDFTGLKDKNEIDVFEGDELKYTAHNGYDLDSCIMTVFYDNENACFGYKTMISMFPEVIFPFSNHDELQEDILNHAEIIGNIYNNIELIDKIN